MKRNSLILAVGLTLFTGMFLAGCSGNKNPDVASTAKQTLGKDTQTPTTTSAPTVAVTKTPVKETMYELKTETFTNKKIVISYPQLVNLSDSAAQNKINEIIKKEALRDKESLLKETEELTYEIKYDITYKSANLLSLKYNGYSSFKGAAHPNHFMFTTNIDVKKQKVLRLKDLVTINESFVEIFKNGKYSSMFNDPTPELIQALKEELNQTDPSGWVKKLNNADTTGSDSSGAYSYLTKDSLVISVSVPYVMGGSADFAINFKDLTKYKKSDNEIWKEF